MRERTTEEYLTTEENVAPLLSSQEFVSVGPESRANGSSALKLVLVETLPQRAAAFNEEVRTCPASNCLFTENPGMARAEEFDAVVFNVPRMTLQPSWTDLFPRRRSDKQAARQINIFFPCTTFPSAFQVYIFYSKESPLEPHGYVYAIHSQPRDFPYKATKGSQRKKSSPKIAI